MKSGASPVKDIRHPARLKNVTVFCVDDDPWTLKMLRAFLEPVGCSCQMATNGAEALNTIRECNDIAVVVTDFAMPVMDGRELCKAIERDHPDLKVVVISGSEPYDLDSFRESAVVTEVLEKPVKRVDLLSTIQSTLEAG